MRIIGLAGAQRVGKSTLARELVKSIVPYSLVETGASKTFARLGKDPKADYPIEERLEIQNEILSDMEVLFRGASNYSIADRTPLDMMAYTLADISRATVRTPELDKAVMDYVHRCEKVITQNFAAIIVVQPGIKIVEEEGKAPGVECYMEHINAICCGLLFNYVGTTPGFIIAKSKTDLKDRVEQCTTVIASLPPPFGYTPVDQYKPS